GTGDLLEHAQRVAGALRERGVGRGDPVAWQLPNGVDPIVLYWATWWLGAVAVPFHPDASAREAESVFTRVVPAITIATADARALTDPNVVVEHDALLDALDGDPVTAPSCLPSDIAVLLTTSGSSGRPKTVIH